MYDSVSNSTTLLGNTTEIFFRISDLLVGHNYTFSVRACCLVSGQLCGEAAVLLYDELGSAGAGTRSQTQPRRRTLPLSRCGEGAMHMKRMKLFHMNRAVFFFVVCGKVPAFRQLE